MQIKQKGYTSNGIFYKTIGHRASGEYTTSDGNSIINYAMLVSYCVISNVKDFRIVVNGDDSIIFMDKSEHHKLLPLTFFNNFGMETTLDKVADDFRLITYCQANPIRIEKDNEMLWYMVKDPTRTISRMSYCDSKFIKCIDRFMLSNAICDLHIHRGVPILQEISKHIISNFIMSKPLGSFDRIPAAKSGNYLGYTHINDVTRYDFEIAFGFELQYQIAIESSLAGKVKILPEILSEFIEKYKNYTNIKNTST